MKTEMSWMSRKRGKKEIKERGEKK